MEDEITVKEFIKMLKKCDPNKRIWIWDPERTIASDIIKISEDKHEVVIECTVSESY